MVLASDGLWDVMTNEDVVEMVQQILAEMAEEDDEREEEGAGAGTGWDVAGAGGPDYHVIARLLTLEVSRRRESDKRVLAGINRLKRKIEGDKLEAREEPDQPAA